MLNKARTNRNTKIKKAGLNTNAELPLDQRRWKTASATVLNRRKMSNESEGDFLSESSEGQYCRLASHSLLSELFEIMGNIGKGAFGSIYKVKHKYDGKIYAVKQVNLIGEGNSEVQELARLNHPNIVRYITCWPSDDCASNQDRNTPGSSSDGVIFERDGSEARDEDEDDNDTGIANLSGTDRMYLFIQMEFCEGGTLTDWIKARKDLKKQRTTMEINKIFYEIISGVEFIHANNLIHRDLKPDNILFGADGKVKIGDFGLVAAQTDQNGDPIKRSNVGTESYWSPEQETEENYEEKTDIFPLGLIWFEMLLKISTSCERGKLWSDLRDQRFPAEFSDKYPTEEQIIKKMLSNTPEDRPHAKDIKEKLDTFFSLEQDLKFFFLP